MKKMLKKALAVLIAAMMIFTALPFMSGDFSNLSASAAEYSSGEIIELGSYPQSRVTDESLIAALNSCNLSWQSLGSLSGSGELGSMSENSTMKYADTEYNSQKYRAVTFSQYRPELTYRTAVEKNSSQDENGYYTNTVYWFAFEPLKWRIIDSRQGLAVSESLVDSRAYAEYVYRIDNLNGDFGDDYFADADGETAANDYAAASVREWLNGEFFDTAFTSAEKEKILTAKLGSEIFDKVFLPSYDEISALSDSDRAASGTDYAKAMGLYSADGNSFWWLRTPGAYSYTACRVSDSGSVDSYGNSVDFTNFGVRPAIKLEGGEGGAYVASFDYGDQGVTEIWFVAGEAVTAPDAPEKEGYEFAGWIDAETGEAMPAVMPSANVTYKPNWKPADGVAYTVETYTMNLDGVSYSMTSAVCYGTTGETVSAEANEKEGFTLDADLSVLSASLSADGTTVLKVYYSRNKYSVSINGAAEEYYFGEEITLTPPTASEGRVFSHWEDQNGEKVYSPFTVPAAATVITPVFKAQTFELTFIFDGEVYKNGQYECGAEITAPDAPEKEGFTFIGWTETEGSDVTAEIPQFMPAANLTYYAFFEKIEFTVTWVIDKTSTEETYVCGQTLTAPQVPEKTGYTFAGWEPQIPDSMPAENMTFTAKWTASEENTLTFKTEILKQDSESGEWIVTDTVAPGDAVKARVYIDTNYYTNAGNVMFFYDKSFFTDSYFESTSLSLSLNPDPLSSTYNATGSFAKIPSSNGVLSKMVAFGYVTQEFIDEHQAFTGLYQFQPSTSRMLNGEYWFAEFDLQVREDATGTGDFFVELGTVQNAAERPKAYVNVPLNTEGGLSADSESMYLLNINTVITSNPVSIAQATASYSLRSRSMAAAAASDKLSLSDSETELEYSWVFFENKTYTPAIYLKYGNEPFDAQKELEITYENNGNVGNASVYLSGVNRFEGMAELGFVISDEEFPVQVKNLKASGEMHKIALTWDASAAKYNVYRKAENEAYALIASTASNSYTDAAVQVGKTYFYYVTAAGAYGVESDASNEVSAAAYADTQAPGNVTMNSASGSVLSGTVTFTASATDNDGLAKAVYSYSADGGQTWIFMGEATDSNFSCTFDTTAVSASSIKVRVIFVDASGNQSEPFVSDFTVSNAPSFTMVIRNPSTTTIKYGDAIILHADVTGSLPAGAMIKWTADNGCFDMEVSADGRTCKISPKSSGETIFTATVVDAGGKALSSDSQNMTSKAGFFQKIAAFFKKIFGLTKTYTEGLF